MRLFPKEPPETFPCRIGRGTAAVVIWMAKQKIRGTTYVSYRIPYKEDGKSRCHSISSWAAARAKGNEMLDQLAAGQADAVMLTNADKVIYHRALEALRDTGTALDTAAIAYAEAAKILKGVSLTAAASFYLSHHAGILSKPAPQAVEEYIAAKELAGRSERHIHDLRHRLRLFKTSFNMDLNQITAHDLQAYFEKLRKSGTKGKKIGARSINNFRGAIGCFLKWAKRRRYLPQDWHELDVIERADDNAETEIVTYSPEQMYMILSKCQNEPLKHALAIGAFAGLRASEICRLQWEQVGVDAGKYIEVKPAVARKTKQRRLTPMQDNLKAWLNGHPATGSVWPWSQAAFDEWKRKNAVLAGVPWKHNALRHSYISYRVAATQDVPQTALEAGTSPQMVFRNYRAVKTEEAAKRWFAVNPTQPPETNIITLPPAAASA